MSIDKKYFVGIYQKFSVSAAAKMVGLWEGRREAYEAAVSWSPQSNSGESSSHSAEKRSTEAAANKAYRDLQAWVCHRQSDDKESRSHIRPSWIK